MEEEWGVEPHTFQYQPFSRRCHRPLWLLFLIVVSAGLEPTHPEPKSGALPLGYETIYEANISKNFFFWGSCQVRTDDSGLQSRDITNYTKRPIFWV